MRNVDRLFSMRDEVQTGQTEATRLKEICIRRNRAALCQRQPGKRAGRQAGRQFERAKQCTAMGYHGIAAALAVLHLGNEAAGCELRIRLNYFMPSMPSFFRAAYIGSHRRETAAATAGTRENRRTKRKRTTRRRQRTRTKRNKNKKRMGGPLDVLYLRLLHTHLL